MCQQQSWYDLHERRPLIPNERMTFGSAVDAAVEQIVVMLRSGNPVEIARDGRGRRGKSREDTGVDRDEVERAAEMFVPQVATNYDWSFCRTQPSIDITCPTLGDINTHPDLVLRGNVVRDVKTGKQAKPDEPTLELGFYGAVVEARPNEPVPTVGYFTWVRVARPYWQIREFPSPTSSAAGRASGRAATSGPSGPTRFSTARPPEPPTTHFLAAPSSHRSARTAPTGDRA
jgi:hypothetical protein